MANKFIKFCECMLMAAFAIVCMSVAVWVFSSIVIGQVFKLMMMIYVQDG